MLARRHRGVEVKLPGRFKVSPQIAGAIQGMSRRSSRSRRSNLSPHCGERSAARAPAKAGRVRGRALPLTRLGPIGPRHPLPVNGEREVTLHPAIPPYISPAHHSRGCWL